MNQPLIAIPSLVVRQAATHGAETILRTKDRGIWKSVSWAQLAERVQDIGSALVIAGCDRGDVVAILSETRPEVVYADLAILGCGAASVAIDPDDEADRIGHILSSSGARIAFVENEEQLDKILTVRDRCPALARVIVFDMKGLRDFNDASCISLTSFVATGEKTDWSAKIQRITQDQPAVIQFPRGEASGMGQILTHGDLLHMITAAKDRLSVRARDERLVLLRLADITERVWGLYLALETGCISNYPEGPDTVIENLQELQPTVLGADAAAWDHLHRLAVSQAKAATTTQRIAYDWAVRAGRAGGISRAIAELFVLGAIRREFGLNRLRLAYVGGQSISPDTQDWARGLGVSIQRVDASGADQGDERFRTLMEAAYA